MPQRKTSAFVLLFVVAGCGGAAHWQLACGCINTNALVAQELGMTTYLKDGSIDPKLVVAKLHEHLGKPGALFDKLEAVRSIGPTHNGVCYGNSNDSIRCTYWLWYNHDSRRGLQLDIKGLYLGTRGSEQITYRYVEESAE